MGELWGRGGKQVMVVKVMLSVVVTLNTEKALSDSKFCKNSFSSQCFQSTED